MLCLITINSFGQQSTLYFISFCWESRAGLIYQQPFMNSWKPPVTYKMEGGHYHFLQETLETSCNETHIIKLPAGEFVPDWFRDIQKGRKTHKEAASLCFHPYPLPSCLLNKHSCQRGQQENPGLCQPPINQWAITNHRIKPMTHQLH